MRLNPFARVEDPLKMELQAQKDGQKMDIANQSNGIDEQFLLQRQREHAELTRWQQDMSEETQLMVHRLRNETQDEEGHWVRNKIVDYITKKIYDADPMCSEECIWRLVALVEPNTSKNLMMSKYDVNKINNVLLELTNTVTIDVLLANRKKYGIKMSDMTPIIEIFKSAAVPTFFRALGGNEKEYLKGIRKDTYLHTKGDDEQKKKSILGI